MFTLKVITPTGSYLQQEVISVTVRSSNGDMAILSNHIPIVAKTKICQFVVVDEQGKKVYAVSEGVIQFSDNQCLYLVESIESPSEIDLQRAEAAKARAEDRLKDSNSDLKRAQTSLLRAINRIQVKNNGTH